MSLLSHQMHTTVYFYYSLKSQSNASEFSLQLSWNSWREDQDKFDSGI